MKKLWLTTMALLALASPAMGATYYVRGGVGSDSNAGTSTSAAWATIGKANSAARPGDVIYVMPRIPLGTVYAHFPNPDSGGSNPTGAGRIVFIGVPTSGDAITDVSARNRVVLPGGTLSKPYTTLKGLRFSGGLSLGETADRCSVASVTADGDLQVNGADYSVVAGSLFKGNRLSVGYNSSSGNHIKSDTLVDNTFPNLGIGVTGDDTSVEQFGRTPSPDGSDLGCAVDSLLFERNRRTIYMDAGSADTHPRIIFNTRYSMFRGNRMDLSVNNPNHWQYALRLRDSTYRDTLVRDTVIATGPGRTYILLSSCGRSDWCPSVFETVVDSCFWNLSGAGAGSYVVYQNTMNNAKLNHSVIVTKGAAVRAWELRGKNEVQFNTLASTGGYVADFSGENSGWLLGAYTDTTLKFRYNIVYNSKPALQQSDPFPGSATGGVKWNLADYDSGMATTQRHAQRRLVSQANVYWYAGYAVRPRDRSIINYGNLYGSLWRGSVPGDSSATNWNHFENTFGNDSLSVYGSPRFDQGGPDSTLNANFNPRIAGDSPARGIATGGADAGAVSYPTAPIASLSDAFIQFQPGLYEAKTFSIANTGDATLTVLSITQTSTGNKFSVSPASASIAAGTSQLVTVTYLSGSTGCFIEIVSDDPVNPLLRLPVMVSTVEFEEE